MGPMGVDIEEMARRCDDAFPRLTDTERRIALAVHRTIADIGPASGADVARAAGVEQPRVEEALGRWPGVYRNEADEVIGFWGLSVQPMDHVLELDGRTLYGWCAWDTLFLPEILGASARVRSRCPATGDSITLQVGPRGPSELQPPQAVVSLLDPDQADVAGDRVISSFCHHIHFLSSYAAWERWARERDNGTFALTVMEAWELGQAVNRLRYGELLATSDGPGAGLRSPG